MKHARAIEKPRHVELFAVLPELNTDFTPVAPSNASNQSASKSGSRSFSSRFPFLGARRDAA